MSLSCEDKLIYLKNLVRFKKYFYSLDNHFRFDTMYFLYKWLMNNQKFKELYDKPVNEKDKKIYIEFCSLFLVKVFAEMIDDSNSELSINWWKQLTMCIDLELCQELIKIMNTMILL